MADPAAQIGLPCDLFVQSWPRLEIRNVTADRGGLIEWYRLKENLRYIFLQDSDNGMEHWMSFAVSALPLSSVLELKKIIIP